jgi:hypothetical protein
MIKGTQKLKLDSLDYLALVFIASSWIQLNPRHHLVLAVPAQQVSENLHLINIYT